MYDVTVKKDTTQNIFYNCKLFPKSWVTYSMRWRTGSCGKAQD